MKLEQLVQNAKDKNKFLKIDQFFDFALSYLDFIKENLQAVIISKNENHYQFFQYKKDGTYNITRPINSNLMYEFKDFEKSKVMFSEILENVQERDMHTKENREVINKTIYTTQQCIGAALDALPAKESNTARKMNGDLFERFIRLIISKTGINVQNGSISVPVEVNGQTLFSMNYQHDLVIKVDSKIKSIGSVKTSSKDRLDKVFIDKFLYNKLTDSQTPHFAIFLNDVQRKGKEGKYSINATFLSGHFKGYTIKLNPLDGVYYVDIRPNMVSDDILKDHIRTFDHFLFTDVWKMLD